MSFFESLLVLLTIAIALLQITRRLGLPYPAMLAGAGVALALIPGAPRIGLDPHTVLPLFIAPALVDAAFDFPLVALRRYWRPLFALAAVAVILTTVAVAGVGVAMAGLPLYAALALGAIVAPPDAAAATAVLSSVAMPKRTLAVLRGESLLNDATALLMFTAAVSFHGGTQSAGKLALDLALAAPAGVLLGVLAALTMRRVIGAFTGTLSANLIEFVSTFGLWIVAERLHLSAVLCVVAYAMTIARFSEFLTAPRMRIHSFAVWSTAVFLLNVLAFLLMGAQATSIVEGMDASRLREAAAFAAAVVTAVIVVRIGWAIAFNRLAYHFRSIRGSYEPVGWRPAILVGWAGMRGLVTLATAFALPATFPQRDLIVLSAFAVVLATLVLQGATLAPLVRVLGLGGGDEAADELRQARAYLAGVGIAALSAGDDSATVHWRNHLEATRLAMLSEEGAAELAHRRQVGVAAIEAQRRRLSEMRDQQELGPDAYLILQEELDFAQVTLTSGEERKIEES